MAEEETEFKITSEEDALLLLKTALDRKIESDISPVFVWDGWPFVNIELHNTPIPGSISPSMMAGFIELQRSIFRSHAILSSGTDNLRSLRKIEKDKFEFRVKVDKGSSLYSINFTEIAQKLGGDVITKMTGTELVVTVISVSLIVAGTIAWKAFLDHRTDERRVDSDDADTRIMLDSFKSHLDHDTKRYEMLTRAISMQPALKKIEDAVEPAREEIVKAIAEENGGTLMGIEMNSVVANEMSINKRGQSTKVNLKRLYRVSKVDTTVPDGFRVTLTDVKSGLEVSASLLDALVSGQHRESLKEAEWKKKPVLISLHGRRLRDQIIDAEITSVDEPNTEKS